MVNLWMVFTSIKGVLTYAAYGMHYVGPFGVFIGGSGAGHETREQYIR